jgi:hypothetical protein
MFTSLMAGSDRICRLVWVHLHTARPNLQYQQGCLINCRAREGDLHPRCCQHFFGPLPHVDNMDTQMAGKRRSTVAPDTPKSKADIGLRPVKITDVHSSEHLGNSLRGGPLESLGQALGQVGPAHVRADLACLKVGVGRLKVPDSLSHP